jgi:tetratricopeptide (TPR) repeat protein
MKTHRGTRLFPRRPTAHLPRVAAALLLGFACLGPLSPTAGAQDAQGKGKDGATDNQSTPHGQPDAKPNPRSRKPVLPPQRSDGARSLDRVPQTAAEKSKALSDLYAQLATAENEAAAKKFSSQIERLWRISGSDTINLLMTRAAKAISEKRNDLAEKLLNSAVSLAPDYAEAFNQRAFYRFTQNQFEAAVGDLRRVLALEPNHYKAMEGLAQIWKETGNEKGAYEVMKRLLEVHPFAAGAQKTFDELKREVEGRGI